MQGVVIQGPTDYCKEIIPAYQNIDNVVWSTWEDEPKENIDYIKSYVDVILNKKPDFYGHLNINLQTTTTTSGLVFLKNKGVTEVLKIRGDVLPNKPELLIQKLKGNQISFLAIAKKGVRRDIYYQLVYEHYSHDYPVDLVMYGNIENLIGAFDFLIEEMLAIPPESLISYNLLNYINKDFNLEYKHFIDSGISFFMNQCLENDIKLNWLKRGLDIVEMHNSTEFYEF